jgi:hypothetical protein
MAKLLKKYYSVYFFFEGPHVLAYPDPDESSSNSHTISLRFFLILYSPLLPKKECYSCYWFLSAISCLTYHTGKKKYFNNPLGTVFSESGLSVTPGIPRSLHIKCKPVYKYLLTCWFYFYFGTANEAVISVRSALMPKSGFL